MLASVVLKLRGAAAGASPPEIAAAAKALSKFEVDDPQAFREPNVSSLKLQSAQGTSRPGTRQPAFVSHPSLSFFVAVSAAAAFAAAKFEGLLLLLPLSVRFCCCRVDRQVLLRLLQLVELSQHRHFARCCSRP